MQGTAPKLQMCLRWDASSPVRARVTASLGVPEHPVQLCALQAAWKGDGHRAGERARGPAFGVQYVCASVYRF